MSDHRSYGSNFHLEHMDDFIFYDSGRSILVAILAVCLDWLQHRRSLRLPHGPHGGHLPNSFRGDEPCFFWYLGIILASCQSSSNGCDMVWRPGKPPSPT